MRQHSYIIPVEDMKDSTTSEGFGIMFYCEAFLWNNARWYASSQKSTPESDLTGVVKISDLIRPHATFSISLTTATGLVLCFHK